MGGITGGLEVSEVMLSVQNLSKQFVSEGALVKAVDGVSFEVKQGELFTLLGPSGCGKTTTLRCVAGLEHPDHGAILIDDQPMFDSQNQINVDGQSRPIGMVFQSYAIWPHMTVFDNVAFPLVHGRRKVPRKETRERTMEMLELVKLADLADRGAPFLSGGQQQRVALARALVYKPKLLLFDEPLSNLDAKLREEMRVEMKRLMADLRMTALYVTHDQVEALTMSDRVAVMHAGKIVEEGTPHDIYLYPSCSFTTTFVGRINLVQGQVVTRLPKTQLSVIDTPIGMLHSNVGEVAAGTKVVLGWRPEAIELGLEKGKTNMIQGIVEGVIFLGEAMEYTVRSQQTLLRVRTEPYAQFTPNQTVWLHLPPERVINISHTV